jgi:hypothetical protein
MASFVLAIPAVHSTMRLPAAPAVSLALAPAVAAAPPAVPTVREDDPLAALAARAAELLDQAAEAHRAWEAARRVGAADVPDLFRAYREALAAHEAADAAVSDALWERGWECVIIGRRLHVVTHTAPNTGGIFPDVISFDLDAQGWEDEPAPAAP